MSRRSFCLPAVLALLLPSLSFGQDEGVRVVTRIVKDTVPAWGLWQSDTFSMNHPSNWTVREGGASDTLVVFSHPQDGSALPVEVVVRNASTNSEQQAGMTQEPIAVKGQPGTNGWQTEYRFVKDGLALHAREEMIIRNNRPYMLTYLAPEGAFDEYLYLADAMIKSFSPVTPEE